MTAKEAVIKTMKRQKIFIQGQLENFINANEFRSWYEYRGYISKEVLQYFSESGWKVTTGSDEIADDCEITSFTFVPPFELAKKKLLLLLDSAVEREDGNPVLLFNGEIEEKLKNLLEKDGWAVEPLGDGKTKFIHPEIESLSEPEVKRAEEQEIMSSEPDFLKDAILEFFERT